MSRLSDISLVTQVAVFHNNRAFDQLVRQYQSAVRRFLLSQTLGNADLSDDLAQETFLKAYTHIGQYRGTSSFLTWLTRIAYNVWYDYCRTMKAQSTIYQTPSPSSHQTPSASSHQTPSTLRMDLYRALSLLREEERTCITLQLIDGYRIDEIADITSQPVGTVKSLLKRGKDKMANYLRNNGYDR